MRRYANSAPIGFAPRQAGVHRDGRPVPLGGPVFPETRAGFDGMGPNSMLASGLLYRRGTHDLLLVSVKPPPGLMVMPPRRPGGG